MSRRRAAKFGCNVQGRPGRVRRLDYETIAAMYRAGMTTTGIGMRLGAHHTTVCYALQRMGVERRVVQTGIQHQVRLTELERDLREAARAARLAASRTAPHAVEAVRLAPVPAPETPAKQAVHRVVESSHRPDDPGDARIERMCELAVRIAKRRMRLCA